MVKVTFWIISFLEKFRKSHRYIIYIYVNIWRTFYIIYCLKTFCFYTFYNVRISRRRIHGSILFEIWIFLYRLGTDVYPARHLNGYDLKIFRAPIDWWYWRPFKRVGEPLAYFIYLVVIQRPLEVTRRKKYPSIHKDIIVCNCV